MAKERLYYLDWLRISAFGLLILFHCFRFFDYFPWHIKNPDQSEWFTQFVIFTTSWRMPLIFFVSGAGTFFALRSAGTSFVNERLKRLIVPYIFGILVLIPPQKYLEFLHYGGGPLSYYAFLGMYPGQLIEPDIGINLVWLGHVAYHIWYLAYLFVMTMLLLPLLRWLSQKPAMTSPLKPGWGQLGWLFIPLVIINVALRPSFPDYLDWADFFHYLYFFLLGYVFTRNRVILTEWVSANLGVFITIAVLTSLATHYFALFTELMVKWTSAPDNSADFRGFVALRSINALAWVLVLLGLAIRYLNRNHRLLAPLGEAVLPVYILHQTIIVAIGYFVVQWSIGIPGKAVFILLSSSLLMVAGFLVVRRVRALRFLFGMKPQ